MPATLRCGFTKALPKYSRSVTRECEGWVVTMVTVEELAEEFAALKLRVDASESVLSIQTLKARYAELVDQRFAKGAVVDGATLGTIAEDIAALFTPEGTWDGGPGVGVSRGRAEIARKLRETTFTFSRHFFLNPRIEVSGNAAKARWDLLSPCRRGESDSYWMCGYEDDEYQRINGEWLHHSMKLTSVFMTPPGEGWSKIFV
jgi:hypothetical protein